MEAYKIGVSIALSNGVSPVLGIISKELLGINTAVKDIERNMGRWALAIGGAASVLAGGAIIKGLSKIADHGREILHQQELMRQAGMSNKEVVEATTKAWQTSRSVQTTMASDNLKHIRELRYATGTTEGATAILDPVSKANAVLSSMKGGGTDQVFEMVKALEQKGLATQEQQKSFLSYVDNMTKVVQATGGRVTSQMFQSTFKYGRTAMLGWDEEFITQILPRLMQSMQSSGGGGGGSGGPGNALMSAFAKVVQGQMPRKAAEEFHHMGLSGAPRHIRGSAQSITNIHGADAFLKNPYEWVQHYLMPALAAHHITNQFAIIQEISKLFPVRTASQIIAEFALQGRFHEGEQASNFEKDRRMTKGATGIAGYDGLILRDPNTIYAAQLAQQENALAAVGVAMQPIKLEIVQGLTKLFTAVAQFASANPETVKAVAVALGIMGGALLVGGVVALAMALGPVPGIIAAAAAAVGLISEALSYLSHVPLPSWLGGGSHPGEGNAVPGTGGDGIPSFAPPSPAPEKHSWNVIPPARSHAGETKFAAVYLDGSKVGDAILGHINDRAGRPMEGAPYHDSTWHAAPLDFALSDG